MSMQLTGLFWLLAQMVSGITDTRLTFATLIRFSLKMDTLQITLSPWPMMMLLQAPRTLSQVNYSTGQVLVSMSMLGVRLTIKVLMLPLPNLWLS
jgi:hypothetical protein